MNKFIILLALVSISIISACEQSLPNQPDGLYALIQTNKGDILTRLEFQKAPLTVANFVGLSEGAIANNLRGEGEPFYDGLTFHRVMNDFMIQGGDPRANGTGGPGYKFRDEINPDLIHNVAGTLSMANAGPNTNGSQFFITHKNTNWLDGKHAVFGYVVDGLPVVYKIATKDTIRHIEIIRKGKEAKQFNAVSVFNELK